MGCRKIGSAFRATSCGQVVEGELVPLVEYGNELFDLGDEYDPATSTFTPIHGGVYSVNASVLFFSDDVTDYRVLVGLQVNGATVAFDNDFWGESLSAVIGNIASVSAILYLQAGDEVTVFLETTTPGDISSGVGTTFEAARFPSPLYLVNNLQTMAQREQKLDKR